jgi:ParB family chromosome partitioning protein
MDAQDSDEVAASLARRGQGRRRIEELRRRLKRLTLIYFLEPHLFPPIPSEALAMTQEAIEYLPVESIEALPQVREQFDENAIIGLAMSLRALGQLVPIRVRRAGKGYFVIDGERRLRAARKAGIATIAAIVEGKELGEGELLHRQISINVQRAELLPLERAKSVERLLKATGWTAKEAAKQLGVSSATISKLLALLSLPETVQAELAQGKISLSTAYELAKVSDPAKQGELADEAAKGRLKRDEVGAAAKRRAPRAGKKPSRRRKQMTATLGRGCSLKIAGGSLCLADLDSVVGAFLVDVKAALALGASLDEFLAGHHGKGGA